MPRFSFRYFEEAATQGDSDRLFGPLTAAPLEEQLSSLHAAYRELVLVVHPDRNPHDVARANAALAAINGLRARREVDIRTAAAQARARTQIVPAQGRSGRSHGPSAVRVANLARADLARTRPTIEGGYDDSLPPPLPACHCVQVARDTLPGRVVFCVRGGQDFAVRVSDSEAVPIAHTLQCVRYRQMHQAATKEEGVTLQSSMFSHHVPGWCWTLEGLKRRAVDHFVR
jgi:hypothetical protein